MRSTSSLTLGVMLFLVAGVSGASQVGIEQPSTQSKPPIGGDQGGARQKPVPLPVAPGSADRSPLTDLKKKLIDKVGARAKNIQLKAAKEGDSEIGGELYRDSDDLVIATDPCAQSSIDKATTFVPEYSDKSLGTIDCPDGSSYPKRQVVQQKPRKGGK